MSGRSGFTLLEVVVAGGLLAIGVLALTTLQAQSLQVQRRVAITRQLVAVAEAELYRSLAIPQPLGGECTAAEATELSSCIVQIESCAASSAPICSSTTSSRATRVTVVTRRASQEFVLSAVHARFGG